MASFYRAPTANFKSTTLDGAIADSDTTITLTSATGFQAPGVIIIDREDGSGTATPNSREVVHYTGISSNDLTGCTRGEENSTARAHTDGALVEAVFTVEQWNDLRDAVAATISTDGADIAITGTASIATAVIDGGDIVTFSTNSIASVAALHLGTSLCMASAATISLILDEDAMTSNSANALATQQSIKAYVDNNAGFGSSRMMANLSSTQNINQNTWTTVVFNNEQYDEGSDYNTSTGEYTVPTTGVYLIAANVEFAVASAGDNLGVKITVNSTDYAKTTADPVGTSNYGINVAMPIYLTAEDVVVIKAYNGNNNDTLQAGVDSTLFAVQRLS